MPAGDISAQITLDGKNYSSAAGKVISINKQIEKSVVDMGHSSVSQMQASSAAIRLLENPLGNNLRAIERLATTIPGLGSALKFAFPVVGAVSLGIVVAKTAEEFTKFIKTLHDMPQVVSNGFRDLNGSVQLANDELKLTNDTIRNHIALMSGKPVNNVAIALDEARIQADKLAASLRRDQEEIMKLIKVNSVGMMGQLFGKGSTKDVEDVVTKAEQEFNDLGQAHDDAVQSKDKGRIAATAKALKDRQDFYRKWVKDQNAMRTGRVQISDLPEMGSQSYAQAYGDQSTNLNTLAGFGLSISQRQSAQQLEEDNGKQTAADKALSAADKAAAAQMKAYQEALEAKKVEFRKSYGFDMPITQEIDFWKQLQAATKAGSKNYLEMQKTIDDALNKQSEDSLKSKMELRKKQTAAFAERQTEDAENAFDLQKGLKALQKAQSEDQDRAAEKSERDYAAGSKLAALQSETAAAFAEATARINEQTGAISRHEAALQVSAAHRSAFQDQRSALQGEAENIAQNPLADPTLQDARQKLNSAQLDKLDKEYGVQSRNDQFAIDSSTLSGSFKDTLQQFVQDSQDAAAQIREVFTSAFQSVNSTLSNVFTARYHTHRDFTRALGNGLSSDARGLGSQVLNFGLQRVEGSALKAFGLTGKPDGSQAKPFYVSVVGGAFKGIGGAAGAVDGVGSRLLSSGLSALKKSGSGLEGVFGGLLSALPAFADGGDVTAGRASIVGERGAELFVPHTSGRIVPNNKLSAAAGTTHNNYFDNRNASDPREIERRVQRSLMAIHGSSVRNSVQASRERMLRRPRIASA